MFRALTKRISTWKWVVSGMLLAASIGFFWGLLQLNDSFIFVLPFGAALLGAPVGGWLGFVTGKLVSYFVVEPHKNPRKDFIQAVSIFLCGLLVFSSIAYLAVMYLRRLVAELLF